MVSDNGFTTSVYQGKTGSSMNKLYFGDNLEILREMPDERVHLICTDPPFNSGRDYNAFLGDSLAQKKAFTDTWTWDTAAQDARSDIEQRAFSSDTYKALDTCLKGYDLVLQNAVSGQQRCDACLSRLYGTPASPKCTGYFYLLAVSTSTATGQQATISKASWTLFGTKTIVRKMSFFGTKLFGITKEILHLKEVFPAKT